MKERIIDTLRCQKYPRPQRETEDPDCNPAKLLLGENYLTNAKMEKFNKILKDVYEEVSQLQQEYMS